MRKKKIYSQEGYALKYDMSKMKIGGKSLKVAVKQRELAFCIARELRIYIATRRAEEDGFIDIYRTDQAGYAGRVPPIKQRVPRINTEKYRRKNNHMQNK